MTIAIKKMEKLIEDNRGVTKIAAVLSLIPAVIFCVLIIINIL